MRMVWLVLMATACEATDSYDEACRVDPWIWDLREPEDVEALNAALGECPQVRSVRIFAGAGEVEIPRLKHADEISCQARDGVGVLSFPALTTVGTLQVNGGGASAVSMPNLHDVARWAEFRKLSGKDVELRALAVVSEDLTLDLSGGALVLEALDAVRGDLDVLGGLSTLEFPALRTVEGRFYVNQNENLQELRAPRLDRVNSLRVGVSPDLSVLDLSSLRIVDESVDLYQLGFSEVLLPDLEEVGDFFRVGELLEMERFSAMSLHRVGGKLTFGHLPELCEVELDALVELGEFNAWDAECEDVQGAWAELRALTED